MPNHSPAVQIAVTQRLIRCRACDAYQTRARRVRCQEKMNRKKLSYIGIGLAAGLLLIVVGIIAQRSHRSANDGMSLILHDEELAVRRLQLAKAGMILQAEMAAVPRNLALSFWGRVVLLGSFSGSLLILAAGGHRAMVKARSVHQYQIGGNVFFVHERDLSIAAPIAMGLVNAENLSRWRVGKGRPCSWRRRSPMCNWRD